MPQQAVTVRDVPDRSAVLRSPDFVGRDQEMTALADALAGGPAVVVVEGEAGVGKSRLVREFLPVLGGSDLRGQSSVRRAVRYAGHPRPRESM